MQGSAFDERDLGTRQGAELGGSPVTLKARSSVLIPAFTSQQRVIHWLSLGGWAVALVILWSWWLRPEHRLDSFWFSVNSGVLAWVTLMPAYLLFVLGRGRIPSPAISLAPGQRVAMVVTKVPSEPWLMVRETLLAMLSQPYPHDTWLADEDPAPETLEWCVANGVSISTRRGCAEYHREEWPRRRRCKEGNLAYFYDHYGYRLYDFVVQLDADHVPDSTYLEEMLRPFVDPAVGYVSAPSICDRNAALSWSARSRLYAEGMLHGGLQVGYNGGLAPLCFGSHYAVRTKALQEIGGLGPELAEDHSTTLLMNAHGWRGVHAVNAIAHGDGPETFADLVTQEFQWSRSLTTILLRYSPRYFGMLPWRLKLQFLFCQIWYALFSSAMAISYALPLIAIVNNRSMVNVTYLDFFVRFQLVTVILMAMGFWWHSNGWARPKNAKAFSWEGAIFLMARWPWSLLGVTAGVVNVLSGKEGNFRITPKASGARSKLSFQVVLPYLLLSVGASWCVLSINSDVVRGYYVFAGINAIFYALVLAIILVMHWLEGRPGGGETRTRRVFAPPQFGIWIRGIPAAAVLVLSLGGVWERGAQGVEFLVFGTDRPAQTGNGLSDNEGGSNKRLAGNYAKLDAAENNVSRSALAEVKPQPPSMPPDASPIWDPDRALGRNSAPIHASLAEHEIVRTVGFRVDGLSGNVIGNTRLTAPNRSLPLFSLEELAAVSRVNLDPPKVRDQQFRPASLRLPQRRSQYRHFPHRAERPPIDRIAVAGRTYTRRILTALGRLISVSSSVRSVAHGNAKR